VVGFFGGEARMFKIRCNRCGAEISGLLPNSTVFGAFVTCAKCIEEVAKAEISVVAQMYKERNDLKWHLGIFEDIGLVSDINIENRCRVASLTRRLNEIIPDSDLEEAFIDVGCNCGHFLRHLWLRGARNLIGAEPREAHLNLAKAWTEKEGADCMVWQNRAVEDIRPAELDGKIVLALGLIYHLPDPDVFLEQIKASTMKYCILESQVFEDEEYVPEGVENQQHAITEAPIWHPTIESVEAKLDKHGFKWERFDYAPGGQLTRGLWKLSL